VMMLCTAERICCASDIAYAYYSVRHVTCLDWALDEPGKYGRIDSILRVLPVVFPSSYSTASTYY
jgi:hypothetical protein